MHTSSFLNIGTVKASNFDRWYEEKNNAVRYYFLLVNPPSSESPKKFSNATLSTDRQEGWQLEIAHTALAALSDPQSFHADLNPDFLLNVNEDENIRIVTESKLRKFSG